MHRLLRPAGRSDNELYGRENELKKVRQVLSKDRKCVDVVLVSGPSGVGKSALFQHCLHDYSCNSSNNQRSSTRNKQRRRLLIGRAKFDAHLSPDPFEAIRTCFTDIILKLQEEELKHQDTHDELLAAIKTHIEDNQYDVLFDLLPSLQHSSAVMSATKPVSSEGRRVNNSMKDIAVKVPLALRSFLRALCSLKKHKVVLLLDDLHWCDEGSFGLLESIWKDPQLENFMLCGTYRYASPMLTKWRENLSTKTETCRNNTTIEEIELGTMGLDQVNGMISDVLDLHKNQTFDLAELVFHRTHGNAFYVQELLEVLLLDGLLHKHNAAGTWTFDLQSIRRSTSLCENVAQVVINKIARLGLNAKATLELAACFGSKFRLSTLQTCQEVFKDIIDLEGGLKTAIEAGLVDRIGTRLFKFTHDKIFEELRSSLPSGDEGMKLHWKIGMLLWDVIQHSNSNDTSTIFLCLDHLNTSYGTELHDNGNTELRIGFVALNLEAARFASKVSAFHPARDYCQNGIEMLPDHPFEVAYDLTIALTSHYAEMLSCVGEMDLAKANCETVFMHARTHNEKNDCYMTMLQILMAQGKNEEVVVFALKALRELGVDIPSAPNKIQTHLDYQKTKKCLENFTDEEVLNLPRMTDSCKIKCAQILASIVMPLLHLDGRNNLSTMVIGKLFRLTCKYGLTSYAPEAFVVAGVDLIARKDELRQGYRFGKLAVALVKKLQANELKARAMMWSTVFTQWWFEPMTSCIAPCIEGKKELRFNSGPTMPTVLQNTSPCDATTPYFQAISLVWRTGISTTGFIVSPHTIQPIFIRVCH